MASGPSDPPRRPQEDDDARRRGASGPQRSREQRGASQSQRSREERAEPRISHSPPGPTDDRPRGLPLASPWGMPPFAAPVPDEPEEAPKGRMPYSSPTAEPDVEPRRRPRRVVDRPDKLVAGGPLSAGPETRPQPASPASGPAEPPEDAEPPEASESSEPSEPGEPEVRRVGRPPAGRPTRPDRLVASGPPRPQGGRHQRGPAPAALRRSSPVRGTSRAVPVALTVAAAVLAATGVLVWQWARDEGPALRLAAGTGRSGDDLFTVQAAGDGADQKLNDMAAVGRAVVAVGSDTTSPTPRPLFLFSPDSGRTWQLGQVDGASTPTVRRVVGGDGRWLAAGGERGLWTSADGLAWTTVDTSAPAFLPGDRIDDIARTASGFVAVGRTSGADGGTGPAAWRSGDGRTWERVETRELEVRELKAVVARGDTLVAVGVPADGEGSRVLRSADGGRTWQATGFQLPEAEPRTGTVAAQAERFVFVPTRRRTPEGDVRVYCSSTGARWSSCGSIDKLGGTSVGVESLISHQDGVAAIAQAGLGHYTVLTSSDGGSWKKRADLGDLPRATLRAFTVASGGTLLAGGDQAASDVDNQLVLMAVPPGGKPGRVPLTKVEGLTRAARETNALAAFSGRYVAVGSASGDAGLWTIQDWRSWKSMSLGGPGRQTLEDVAHGGRGWLAVGSTETDVSFTDPLLVTSSDGESWRKVEVKGDLARQGDLPYLRTGVVAAGGGGYVVVGESRDQAGASSAVVWFTRDLRTYTRAERLPRRGAGVRVHDVVAVGGGYVAVGASGDADREASVVWFSEDGLNWSARPRVAPQDATSAGLRRVAVYRDQLVAIGTAVTGGQRRPFAAVSDDEGASWRTAWLPAEQAAVADDLAAAADGLVAVGRHGTPGEGDSAAWTSTDGLSWNRVELTQDRLAGRGAQRLSAVAVTGSEVVALGRSTTYSADHLILWTSSLSADK
ncbi:hypothetical protein [Nonomuraea maritima]|uniref:hypothetical protein n=1 Tax=Nonomuraea maritima TaxID=683260 RepID=UPI00371AB203